GRDRAAADRTTLLRPTGSANGGGAVGRAGKTDRSVRKSPRYDSSAGHRRRQAAAVSGHAGQSQPNPGTSRRPPAARFRPTHPYPDGGDPETGTRAPGPGADSDGDARRRYPPHARDV